MGKVGNDLKLNNIEKMTKTIIIIIIGTIILAVGMIMALKTVKPMYLNVISGIIIVIGTFFGLFGKQLQDKSSSEKSDKIIRVGENTIEKVDDLKLENKELKLNSENLFNKIERQANTIDKLRQENLELYSNLVASNKNISDNLTGGESYLEVWLGKVNEHGIEFYMSTVGKNSLSNLVITLSDATLLEYLNTQTGKITINDLNKTRFTIEKSEMTSGLAMSFMNYKWQIKSNQNVFFINTYARNGSTTEKIIIRIKNDKYLHARFIYKNYGITEKPKLISQYIQENFINDNETVPDIMRITN